MFSRTASTHRLVPRLATGFLFALAALTESARAGDTTVFSDGSFGAGWSSSKIVDTTPSALATFVSTTQLGGIPGSYRNTSQTFNAGTIRVAHFDPQYTHLPSTTPICSIDFAASLTHITGSSVGGAVEYRLGLRQSGVIYGGPSIDVFDTFWASYVQNALHSEDFILFAGTGPLHPDFTCTGGAIEFGFLTGNSAGGGPVTKVSGIDNWLVTVHLDSATFSDGTLLNGLWIPVKVFDSTPSALATFSNVSFTSGGNPTDYRQTTHTYTNGAIIVAHLWSLAFHDPAVEPVYTVDFSADAQHQTSISIGGAVGLRPAIWQGSGYYAGPTINVFSGTWNPYALNGLTSSDFALISGGGPVHPNFTNSGTLMQFGYMTSNSASGGPTTKVLGLDNWFVKANLAPRCPGTLGIPSCFGDDITNPCPCFPSVPLGGVGRGCPNSIEPRGALLIGTGTASIANDTVILQGTSMPNSFCMYFQGTTFTGVPFGDGRLCASGSIVRLAVKLNICNSSQYPASNEPTISVQGGIVTPSQRLYQIWYRDAALFCTGATYNLTNSLAINWTL
ncbi:MAG: hypothetical protein SGI72_11255 [Planctomycetota bacterium]|nr:hypothetical protein [Planctomycetota bacterium]